MNEPFEAAVPVIKEIENAGYEAYFVGGSVRDFLLNKEISDVDIATSATPNELKKIFNHTVDVGIAHGTILVIVNGTGFEITTYRTESNYRDYRRPESVSFVRSLHEDLKRRDFTMNAIAMDAEGRLIDPFDGQGALKEQVIKTVGSADDRFQEDALRLMRAIRFISQLGFALDKKTEAAMSEHAHLLKHIAIERITSEMTKLLNGQYKSNAIETMVRTKLYHFLPSVFNNVDTLNTCKSYNISPLKDLEMWLLGLFIAKASDAAGLLRKWKLPVRTIKKLTKSLSFLQWRNEHDWSPYDLFTAGREIAILVEKVYKTLHNEPIAHVETNLAKQFNNLVISTAGELAVSGDDLLKWAGSSGGPWVRDVLEKTKKAVLNDGLQNNKQEIRRWMESCQLLSENR